LIAGESFDTYLDEDGVAGGDRIEHVTTNMPYSCENNPFASISIVRGSMKYTCPVKFIHLQASPLLGVV
jgi:hypothetical protein